MSLRYLITISGIFSKSNNLDILPPPPPFPKIGEEAIESKSIGKEEGKKEVELKRRKEKEAEEKRKFAAMQRNEKLRDEERKARKKKTFNFFHGLGLVKSEKEKIGQEKQKQKEIRFREQERKKAEDDVRKIQQVERKTRQEQERKKRAEEKRKEQIGRRKYKEYLKTKEEARKKLGRERQQKKQKQVEEKKPKELGGMNIQEQFKVLENEAFSASPAVELEIPKKKIPKKPFFEKIFGKKKEKTELERELQDLEGIELKPIKKEKTKTEIISKGYDLKEIEKEVIGPEQIRKTEEEIQNAISGIKVKRKPFIAKGLFGKKKPVEEEIATPGVMPRTYDKIDYVEEIEEKLHKARLALMDFKFDEAKMAYIEIMQAYNTLNPKDKHKVYRDIKDLYYERKGAEKFANIFLISLPYLPSVGSLVIKTLYLPLSEM